MTSQRRSRLVRLVEVATLLIALMAGSSAGAAPRAAVVGTDPAGDWNSGAAAPAGVDYPGLDLLRASIGPSSDGRSLEFTLDVTALPQVPSSAVYEWYFRIGYREFGFYGPCAAHVYGDCATATDPLAFVVSEFTAGRSAMGIAKMVPSGSGGQVVFPLPQEFLRLRKGEVIKPGAASNNNTDDAVVAHTTYFVNGGEGKPNSPRDFLDVTVDYRVQ